MRVVVGVFGRGVRGGDMVQVVTSRMCIDRSDRYSICIIGNKATYCGNAGQRQTIGTNVENKVAGVKLART